MPANPDGMRFNQLKQTTKLHQDTLSARLRQLTHDGIIRKEGTLYRISQNGTDDLYTRELINQISSSPNYSVVGRHPPLAGSIYADDDVIVKSMTSFAFPAIPHGVIASIRNVVQKYWMAHELDNLARNYQIDPRHLTGERPPELLIDDLRKILHHKLRSKQVLAFTIDLDQLVKNLNLEYINEILRIARNEDQAHIENKRSQFIQSFQGYARRARVVEYLKDKGEAPLEDIAGHLGISPENAIDLLNDMTQHDGASTITTFDENGKKLRTTPVSREIEMKSPGGLKVKLRIVKNRAPLHKTQRNGIVYYRLDSSK